MCVWADWTHLQLLADETGVGILLRDAAADFKLVIRPSEEARPASCCGAAPYDGPPRFLHLVRVNQCHYNLFAAGDRAVFSKGELEQTSLDFDV